MKAFNFSSFLTKAQENSYHVAQISITQNDNLFWSGFNFECKSVRDFTGAVVLVDGGWFNCHDAELFKATIAPYLLNVDGAKVTAKVVDEHYTVYKWALQGCDAAFLEKLAVDFDFKICS